MLYPPKVPEGRGNATRFVYRTRAGANAEDCTGGESGIELRKREGGIAVTVRSREAAKRPAGKRRVRDFRASDLKLIFFGLRLRTDAGQS